VDEKDKTTLRNVIVVALADGKLTDDEKRQIEDLRTKLGVGGDEFAQLCEEFRADPKRIVLPREAGEAAEVTRLMVEMAAADGQVSAAERRLLERLVDPLGLDAHHLDAMIDEALGHSDADRDRIEADLDALYGTFASLDAEARRAKVRAAAEAGPPAVVPLLKVLESYRTPDGAADALELKTLVAEALGDLGDARAIYYLAQHVSIGDTDDEVSNAALRFACAEAIGKIVDRPFGPDQDGMTAARQWWLSDGAATHNRLAM